MREQLELAERCEKGMIHAEAHIRDTAIDAISAVRKREKELMADLRESVGEKTLKLVAEKGILRENLKNVEATFKVTDVMLKGTSIELLMVKKEIQEKLNNILEQNVEKIPENLQRCLEFSSGNHYHDILGAVKHTENGYHSDARILKKDTKILVKTVEVQTDVAELRNAETVTENDFIQDQQGVPNFSKSREIDKNMDTPIKMVVNYLPGSERELELIQPVEFIVPIEYITPVIKEEQNETLSESHKSVDQIKTDPATGVLAISTSESATPSPSLPILLHTNSIQLGGSGLLRQDRDSKKSTTSTSFERDQLVLPTPPGESSGTILDNLQNIENGIKNNYADKCSDNILNGEASITENYLRKIETPPGEVKVFASHMVSTGTGMELPTLRDSGTSTSFVSSIDKETSTPHIITTNKCVSTDNQEMVDKSTATVIDVTAVYRNMTSSRCLVTVSRGTCTPRVMFPMEIFPPAPHVVSGRPQVI